MWWLERAMVWHGLLSVFLLLLSDGPSASVNARRDEMCRFPSKWEGTWFQSGVRSLITIELGLLSNKGRCVKSDGDKFLVVDDKSECYRCIVIHEKHINVLQYKETFCHSRSYLQNLCSLITGDALLYSMFRLNAQPVHCPFKPPLTFTYNRGHGVCRNPVSNMDGCIEESKLLLRYQACPDVSGTESTVEELECVATWKEGSSRYLVGKVSHSHITSNEDRFRCFIYEKTSGVVQEPPDDFGFYPKPDDSSDFRLAQSGDATCNGLFSPMEGSRTMTLKKVATPQKCRYPAWLTYFQHWHTLDYRKSYTLHNRNTTLRVSNNSDVSHGSMSVPEVIVTPLGLKSSLTDSGEIRLVCHEVRPILPEQISIVAHYTVGCQSGFVCLMFYRRDLHVIELQSGEPTRRPDEACSSQHFNASTLPYITLVTTNPEPRECPYAGRFAVTGMTQMERQKRSSNMREPARARADPGINKRDLEDSCDEEAKMLLAGCETTDTLELQSTCASRKRKADSAFSCHGRWKENDTGFLITTPQSRTSLGAKRFCFIYKEEAGVVHFSSFSHTCVRNISAGVDGVLAFNATNTGGCVETSRGSTVSNVYDAIFITALAVLMLRTS